MEVETKDFSRTKVFREKVNAQQVVKSIPLDDLDTLGFELAMSLQSLLRSSHLENSSDASNASGNIQVEQVLEEQKIPILYVSQIIRNELARVQEQVRQSNSIKPETKSQILSEIEKILFALADLFERLDQPNRDDSETWAKEFSKELRTSISNLCSAKNVASITVPTTLILGCGALGAMLGGPVGFGAGSVFGHLISGQMKPGAATKQLEDTFKGNDS